MVVLLLFISKIRQTLENTEGAIKNGKSRETAATYGMPRRQKNKTKTQHNTICV